MIDETKFPLARPFLQFLLADPERTYDFVCIDNCALAQFGQSLYPQKRISAGDCFFQVNCEETIWVIPRDAEIRLFRASTFGEAAALVAAKLESVE